MAFLYGTRGELLSGFIDLQDVVNERVSDQMVPVITDAITQTIAVHNQTLDQMMALFVDKISEPKLRYRTFIGHRLQPLDENGRARKSHASAGYEVGYPIQSAGDAWGIDRMARIKSTVGIFNDTIATILNADKTWVRDHILAAIFNNTNYTFEDPEFGELPVKALANQDGTLYLPRPSFVAGEQANHYRTVSAIDNTNQPFDTIHRDLTKRVENAGEGSVIVFIGSNLTASVRALANFIEVEDPDIIPPLTASVLAGAPPVNVPGELIGKVDRCWIYEWSAIPDSYLVGVTTAGNRPVGMREHKEAELRGFNAWADRADAPYFERQFDRHAGFAAWNRVGAVVYQVTGGSYTVPTGYTLPMS